MAKTLYNTADVKEVRDKLYEQQKGIDPITGMKIPEDQKVLDHCHKTQYVRAVLHRQSNAVCGKLENLWTRYLGWWYTGTLSDFLRGCADYLEKEHPQEYVHPKWTKKVTAEFNKLTSVQRTAVLAAFTDELGKNDTERKKIFKKLLTKKAGIGFVSIIAAINKAKEVV